MLFRDDFIKLKGMYKVIKRNRFIFINSNLPEGLRKIVCAHEIGHDQFHRELAKDSALREFMLYDMKSRPEYEANVFAATLLLPDEEVTGYVYEGYDAEQIAMAMNTDINLVALKIEQLRNMGWQFRPIDFKSDFLK